MNVAVLGKGLSLNNYVELPDVDHYIIVNNFDQEILQNEKLKHDLSIKPITHVANRNKLSMDGMISNDIYGLLNIVQHVQPYVDEMKCTHGGCYCNCLVDGHFYVNDDFDIKYMIKNLKNKFKIKINKNKLH